MKPSFRRTKRRTALVPNQWSGSVQQYYHFLLGYLAPIIRWVDKNRPESITVRDCGPMNRWFEVLTTSVNIEIMQVGHFLHVFAGDLQPCVILRGMDFPEEFSGRDLSNFRRRMMELLKIEDVEAAQISILERRRGDPFYYSPESEIDLSGSERRSVPNLVTWAESLPSSLSAVVFDSQELSIREQVERMSRTRILIGQHGAGLVNMVFMPPGGTIIEIQPPLPTEVVELFSHLARACGHHYVEVAQESVHARVDEGELQGALFSVLSP